MLEYSAISNGVVVFFIIFSLEHNNIIINNTFDRFLKLKTVFIQTLCINTYGNVKLNPWVNLRENE